MSQDMFVFYSEYCSHSRMLIENIRRQPNHSMVKIVCIENLRAKGIPIPASITAVPTLVIPRENGTRQMLTGKQVFDYLLMPGRGVLVTTAATATPPTPVAMPGPAPMQAAPRENAVAPESSAPEEPDAFVLSANTGSAFAFIVNGEYNDQIVDDTRAHPWGMLNEDPSMRMAEMKLHEDTRGSAKPSVDLDRFRQERDRDLQNVYEGHDVCAIPIPQMTSGTATAFP